MKIAKNKIAAITIAMFFILSMTASVALVPSTRAQAIDIPTFLFVTASPNPVGVDQTVYLGAIFSEPAPTVAGYSGDLYTNVTIDITDPSGIKTVMGPYTTSPAAGVQLSYTPSKVGNYTIQAHYPGQKLTGTNPGHPEPGINLQLVGSTMLPDDSNILTLVVQKEPVGPIYQSPPLPTEFWVRPIYATNWAWGAELGSNWFGLGGGGAYDASGNVLPNGTAPTTAHIMWTKPTQFGGQPGEPITSDESSQYSSTSLITLYFKPICILNGILYYNKYAEPAAYNYPSSNIIGWEAIDLHTGQVLWDKPAGITGTEAIVYGQIVNYNNFQEYGSDAILYSQPGGGAFGAAAGNWMGIYDAYTGTFLANITNPVSARLIIDPTADLQGAIVGYYVSNNNLCMYNITTLLCPTARPPLFFVNTNFFRPLGTINGSDPAAIQWSVPLPTTFDNESISLSIAGVTPDVILMRYVPNSGFFISITNGYSYDAGYDAHTGALLWGPVKETGWPAYESVSLVACREGYYVLVDKDTGQAYGFDLNTGKEVWGPVQLVGNGYSHVFSEADIAYGKVYIYDLGGYVNAIDLATGKLAWTFYTGNSGYDTPFGSYEIMGYGADSIADGMLFLSEGKLYTPPLHPAYRLAINCTDGKLVWKILQYGPTCVGAIGDGYLIDWNSFDNQIYCFGKGPTDTTVAASPAVSAYGSSVLVTGTVMDTSGGTNEDVITTRFPSGLPAVSDASMEAWMEYAYMQQIEPTNTTGVPVTLTVLDSNGNCRVIGTTTSDSSGTYSLLWKPDIPGNFTVYATFAGTQSYYGSSAETHFAITSAAPTAPPYPSPVTGLASTGTVMLGVVALAVIIIIIGVVLAVLVLRKRP